MDCLALMFDGGDMLDEVYMDGSGSEHGIYKPTTSHSTSLPSRNSQAHTITERKRISSGYRVLTAASTQGRTGETRAAWSEGDWTFQSRGWRSR